MVMNLTQQMSNWQLNLWYAWLTQQGTMCLPHKKPYLSILPVLELLGYKLGPLDMKVPGSAQHCKRHLYPTPNTRTRGGAGVARRDAEWRMARLCWDPPLLSVAGIPSTRGFGTSPAQPDKEFPFLILASCSTCTPPRHPSSPLLSLWQASESLNWVMNFGEKKLSLLPSALLGSLNLMSWAPGLPAVHLKKQPERMAWGKEGGGRWRRRAGTYSLRWRGSAEVAHAKLCSSAQVLL